MQGNPNTPEARMCMIKMICEDGADYDTVRDAVLKLPGEKGHTNDIARSSYDFIKRNCRNFNELEELKNEHIKHPYSLKEFQEKVAEYRSLTRW